MKLEKLTEILDECLTYVDVKCFENEVSNLLEKVTDDEALDLLSNYLHNYYSSLKADSCAGLLQIIIRKKPALALLGFPDNTFFKSSMLHGSTDLFDCYLEEFVVKHVANLDEADEFEFYTDLAYVAGDYNDTMFSRETPIIKGLHFNGIFATCNEHLGSSAIHTEDYHKMDSVVEKFNAILGRKSIVDKLNGIIEKL